MKAAQKQRWDEFCSKADDELRVCERRAVPDAGPWLTVFIMFALMLVLAVPLIVGAAAGSPDQLKLDESESSDQTRAFAARHLSPTRADAKT